MKAYSTVYVVNIIIEAIFSLLFQIGICTGLAWLLVNKLSAPEWVYIPAILFGVFTGIAGMIRFILRAMNSLERLEKERNGEDGNTPDA